jgi:hypothetical protein
MLKWMPKDFIGLYDCWFINYQIRFEQVFFKYKFKLSIFLNFFSIFIFNSTTRDAISADLVGQSSRLGRCCRCMHQVDTHPRAALAGVGARSWRSTMTRSHSLTATLLTTLALAGCQLLPLNMAVQEKTVMPTPPTSMISPLVEKRETLVATGYAVISVQNHKNPSQQRLLAIRASKLDAYRSLTEQVYGQQLDASTTVADMTVMSDTFRAKVEGVIYGATMVSITPVGDDTYETTLSLDQHVVRDLRALYLGQMASRRR